MHRRRFVAALAAAAATGHLPLAQGQSFPARPVKIVVPWAAGGGPDVMVRRLAPPLGEILGQPVVVENKVGAGGIVAAQVVAQAAPDGYTLMVGANAHLVQKQIQPAAAFDPIKDFVPVGNLSSAPAVLVVRADSKHRNVADLVAALKAEAGRMNYGSGGVGSSAHLAGATFLAVNGASAVHVPMRGSVDLGPAFQRGDIDFSFPIAGTALAEIRAGRVRALGVTSRQRLKELPAVPTMAEATGQPLLTQETWFGLWAPAGTPAPVVQALHGALAKLLADPQVQAQLEAGGAIAMPSASPQEYAAFVRSENQKWSEIVKLSAARVD